ncbi:MAG: ATP-dependent zinc metalloprotease FtsH [Spirochaetota bacterium]|jgi:cell division protease FtsH|nr:ATP-dependent zinc metalloprotease FtsH [Spirochaetota bacterium]
MPPQRDPRQSRNIIFLLFTALLLMAFFLLLGDRSAPVKSVPYTKFLDRLSEGRIEKVNIIEQELEFFEKDEGGKSIPYKSYIPYLDPRLMDILREHKVEVHGEEKSQNTFLSILLNLLPWVVLIFFVWFIMMRQIQGSNNKAMSFGKSRAKLIQGSQKKVNFADVAGVLEAKQELAEVVDFLVEPGKYRKLGARIPKGVLLVGPPGTGKTLLARAVAGEADVPFYSISGSDFVEMFVGVGASRVRDLFEQGKKKAPCILFIDELDAVGRARGAGYGGGHDEREQTLNQMLVEMDGFEANEGLIVLAATNRPDVLDPALLRPGRFDRQVVVDAPDIKGREEILKVHTRGVPLTSEVNLTVIARGTPGFTGADLENMINEAALLAARRNKMKISQEELDEAKDKVLMGPERRSLVISEEEKRNTAWHEAGHALLGYMLPYADPIHKVTIIPRGRALGLTQSLPIDERRTYSREYLLAQITLLMGGRVAEERYSAGNVTTGASNDIERATHLARSMVCEWGMSERLGPLSYGQKEMPIFIGKEISRHKDYSERQAEAIDAEIKAIVDSCYDEAVKLLHKYSKALETIANALIQQEVLEAGDLETIARKHGLSRLDKRSWHIGKKNASLRRKA